ncbi:MAG: DUF4331 domain-containing protein [Verrucomicrobia bacterium]|nr:DUF4331 domain-containing protein [Verrucomicrobiota bacterium]
MKSKIEITTAGLLACSLALGVPPAHASSHMDAPLVTRDPAANTTDVYAFLNTRNGVKYLEVALGVYPHQEPGIGPNKYNFDDGVLYQIFLSRGADLATGADSVAYQFQFSTAYKTQDSILQSYVGVVAANGDSSQNLTQTYTVTKVVGGTATVLGTGTVPPNNQGIATPKYNRGNDGSQAARDGVATESGLDEYTAGAIANLGGGYRAFAGQRDDGFFADIHAIFDLLALRSGAGNTFDSQGGYNLHMIVLEIPVSDIGGDQQVVGVYATTSRRATTVLTDGSGSAGATATGNWVQIGRQGNPLFCEAFVAIKDKDLYNRTKPTSDAALFKKYSDNPELAALINALVLKGNVAPTTNRADLSAIFIPDLIKVDLSTVAARKAGGGANHPALADDTGFSRLGVFGGDVLESPLAGHPFRLPGSAIGADATKSYVPGGWPNGRRFGDDVVDIGVTAVISDLRAIPLTIRSADGIDNVSSNDAIYHKVFPYAATPHNGRNSAHNPKSAYSPLLNISARGVAGTGANALIGAFILRGTQPVQVLVRALGASLGQFGVTGQLADTAIDLYQGTTLLQTNDDWRTPAQGGASAAAITATGMAPLSDSDSAILITLPPGAYSTIVRGKNNATGIAIVEAFLAQ